MAIPKFSMKSAIAQVEKCDFECEGGPLRLNVGWMALKEAAEVGPEYWPGQRVFYEISAEVAGKKLSKWEQFTIVGLRMESDTDKCFWLYTLSADPPGPWHYGTVHFTGIRTDKLRAEMPVAEAA